MMNCKSHNVHKYEILNFVNIYVEMCDENCLIKNETVRSFYTFCWIHARITKTTIVQNL